MNSETFRQNKTKQKKKKEKKKKKRKEKKRKLLKFKELCFPPDTLSDKSLQIALKFATLSFYPFLSCFFV